MPICKYCNTFYKPEGLCPVCNSQLDGWYEQIAEDNDWETAKHTYDPDNKETKLNDRF